MIRAQLLCLLAISATLQLQSTASAANVWLSLNLQFNTLDDVNSGGTWAVVAKGDPQGIAGVNIYLANATTFGSFLAPLQLDARVEFTIGSVRNIVIGWGGVPPRPLGIGVIGSSFPSSYVDPDGIVPFGSYADYGSFTGGVPLATGTFSEGIVPDWTTSPTGILSDANLFTGPNSPIVDADTLLTVRYVVPEPSAFTLLAEIGLAALAMWKRHRRHGCNQLSPSIA
jgi:hypothetical protein